MPNNIKLAKGAPYIVLLAGVLLSLLACWHFYKIQNDKEQLRFESTAHQIALLIQSRMDAYKQVLLGGAGLFESSNDVTRSEWASYVATQKINNTFPGIQGMGYSLVVKADERESHVKKIKSEGFPDYAIKPEGQRDLYTSIIYLEPFNERNMRAFGYDMFSESVRREAMTKAMLTGNPSLSGKVRLKQENSIDEQAGFLMYVPLYKKGHALDGDGKKMSAIKGFVYAPFRVKDLLNGVVGNSIKGIDFEIHDVDANGKQNILFDSNSDLKHGTTNKTYQTSIFICGREWLLKFEAVHTFNGQNHENTYLIVLFGGLMLSLAVWALLMTLVRTEERAVGIANDMTKKLSISEERLRYAMEGVGDGLWDWDIKSEKVFFSKRWKEMLGFEDNEIENSLKEWENRVHPDDLQTVSTDVKAHFDGETQMYINEHRVRCKDGSYKWILDRGVVVERNEQNEPVRMVGSHTDINDRKIAEEALRQINKHLAELVKTETQKALEKEKLLIQQSKMAMMGEMIGAIAHQWRQPLSSLTMMVQTMAFMFDHKEVDKKYIEEFKKDTMGIIDNMSKTIDDFRNFFSPNKKAEQFFIEDAVGDILKILSSQLSIYAINVIFDESTTSKHPYVCYKNELKQVLLNILANAKDALVEKTPANPFIKIDVYETKTDCEISIEDSGGGIPEEIIGKIFDYHFTTKEEGKGTGIGLYMSKEIVHEHLGGKLTVSNTQNGAKFIVSLPKSHA